MAEIGPQAPPKMLAVGLDVTRAASFIKAAFLDGIFLTSPENVYYTTGYPCVPGAGNPILHSLHNQLPAFAYLDSTGSRTLLCWGFSTLGVTYDAESLLGYEDLQGALQAINTLVKDKLTAASRIGIESSCPKYVLDILSEAGLPMDRLMVVDDLIYDLRIVKSPAEIELCKASLQMAEDCLEELLATLSIGQSRRELLRFARQRLAELGATGISHLTISLGRENPEVAVDEIAKGDSLVTLDVGAILDGYASDCRRYAYLGNPPTEVVELHEAMIEAVETVARALQPGTPYSELYGIAKDFMIKSDITGHEWLSHVGHSIGLETEEDWLDNRNDRYLHEGMVVAVELYTITSQLQPIGNEETYLIGADGPQRLTRLPAELRCIA